MQLTAPQMGLSGRKLPRIFEMTDTDLWWRVPSCAVVCSDFVKGCELTMFDLSQSMSFIFWNGKAVNAALCMTKRSKLAQKIIHHLCIILTCVVKKQISFTCRKNVKYVLQCAHCQNKSASVYSMYTMYRQVAAWHNRGDCEVYNKTRVSGWSIYSYCISCETEGANECIRF